MSKDYRITIEPISKEAKQRTDGVRVFDCDFLICMAGYTEPRAEGKSAMSMQTALIGNKRHVATALIHFLDDMDDEVREALAGAIFEKMIGMSRAESISRESAGRTSFGVVRRAEALTEARP